MSLNNEYRFGSLPTTKLPRSTFFMKKNWKGTFNTGQIIPFYVRTLVVPSSTYRIKQSIVLRSLTPIYPTMDDLVLDVYFFGDSWFRLWNNFKKFMGENESGEWVQTADLEVPMIKVPSTASGNGVPNICSIWDYMGLATGVKGDSIEVSALPFRMYCDVYNYFFRNQNLIAPIATPKGDANANYDKSLAYTGGTPLKASKLPSYFTTSLPDAQKSPNGAVTIPLGTSAPIYGTGHGLTFAYGPTGYGPVGGLKIGATGTPYLTPIDINRSPTINNGNANRPIGSNAFSVDTSGATKSIGVITKEQAEAAAADDLKLTSGMYADLSEATAATLNALRLKGQTQMIYERDGMFGTRYFDEILYGHYGTTSGAAKWEKPQYIGGKRIPIVMQQVAATADTTNNPLGTTGAFSLTADVDYVVNQSFSVHSIILGVMVVRQLTHTTQQGIPRQWSIKKRLDMWWHEYDHLGNQPVYNKEIYADGSSTDNEVFGYQERYAEYRYEENTISGEFKSTGATPLDAWHYGDNYGSLPTLSQDWIEENDLNVARTLAIQNHNQFMCDTTLYIKCTQPLPVYGTPGLFDHF